VDTAILARHGESEFSVRGALNGDAGVPGALTAAGREQARRLGEQLAGTALDLCITSALQRTRETADDALGDRSVPRLVLPELNDPRYGRFEGALLSDYRAWAWNEPSSAVPGPGGESRLALVERYAGAYRAVLARPEETILVVGHSLPTAYALAAREGRPPAPRVPLVEYAEPLPFTAEELDRAAAVLEAWVAAPTW
jgi:ribonuclease H / adenosylcobalamin/alpha-ribazole phosphatase